MNPNIKRNFQICINILLKLKVNILFVSFMGTIFLSVFEIVRLNIVPIKACGSILIDYSHPALPYSHLFQICNPSAINCSHNFHTSHLHYQYLQESCKLNIGLFGPIFSDLYKQSLPLQFFNISELNILTLSFSDTVAVPVDYINFFILISVILKSLDVLFIPHQSLQRKVYFPYLLFHLLQFVF